LETNDLIRNFILENITIGASQRSIGDNDSVLEKGIIDSTGILELVSFVEETFGLQVKDDELIPDNFDSVGRLARYINRKKGC
jgi:acyl carrier protein